MMSIFDPTLSLTFLTHPFQVALMGLTLGALVRTAKPMATSLVWSFLPLVDVSLRSLARRRQSSSSPFSPWSEA